MSPSRPKLLATNPGWTALAVTPVSSQRRASSRVKRMLASFVFPYTRNPRYRWLRRLQIVEVEAAARALVRVGRDVDDHACGVAGDELVAEQLR